MRHYCMFRCVMPQVGYQLLGLSTKQAIGHRANQYLVHVHKRGFSKTATLCDKTDKVEGNILENDSSKPDSGTEIDVTKTITGKDAGEKESEILLTKSDEELAKITDKELAKIKDNDKPKTVKTKKSKSIPSETKDSEKSSKKTKSEEKHIIKSGSLTQTEILSLFSQYKLKYLDGYTNYVANCLKIRINMKPVKNEAVYINKTTGFFTCFLCKKQGSWSELQANFNVISKLTSKKNFECFCDEESKHKVQSMYSEDTKQVEEILDKSTPVQDLSMKEFQELQQKFGFEKILKSTMVKHKIAFDKEKNSLLIPYLNSDLELSPCLRQLTLVTDEETETTEIKQTFTECLPNSIFGWTDGDIDKKKLVLTLTERDAMSVQQATQDLCVLSIPRDSQLPQEVLPHLERFNTIIMWFGCDMRSWMITKLFARKFGTERCYVYKPSDDCPAPHEALKMGYSLERMLEKAKPIKNDSITSFLELRNEVLSELTHHEQVSGTKWQRFSQMNKLLKGFRPGELTVLTGKTGSGKTTFMSEYSLDLCMQGVNTLWGSFEVNNVRLAKTMLTQFCKKNLTLHLDEFEYFAEEFQRLPMYFMTFFGQESITKVIETMAHAVYIHDIQHVIVDNLQFMMGDEMFSYNRFITQDKIYASFRKFASLHNCHLSLVIHPRKEDEDAELTTSSIFGSAKATQEADNILLLQDKRMQSFRDKKFIQISKNRFDGELGVMNLKFDTESLTFSNVNVKTKKKKEKKEIEKYEDSDDEI